MKRFALLAVVFLLCSGMNLVNVYTTGNGFSLILAGVWLLGSFLMFLKYRQEKKKCEQEDSV